MAKQRQGLCIDCFIILFIERKNNNKAKYFIFKNTTIIIINLLKYLFKAFHIYYKSVYELFLLYYVVLFQFDLNKKKKYKS